MVLLPENYGCLHIDCTWKDILAAYSYTFSDLDRKELQARVEGLFGGSNQWLACISVRSAFDLFLTVVNFPKGSEIIYTAINIPDMTEIAEHHGLKVVPVDVDIDTLSPKEELLELAITDKTVAILAAHIYGKWINLQNVFKIAKYYGLYVLEDCAECFHGLKMKGDKKSDLVFFSFGSIKYNTALGGAVVKINDAQILSRMRAKLESYPCQTHLTYFQKLIKYSLIMMGMNSPTIRWLGINMFHLFRIEYQELFISFLRGFPGNLMTSLRYQPSAALLALMVRRITNVREEDFGLCRMKGDYVKERMPDGVVVPGCNAEVGNYWLFPILVDNPVEVCRALEKEGIEPYIGATQLRTVKRTQPVTCKCCITTGCIAQQDNSNVPCTPSYPTLSKGMLSDVEIGAASADGHCFVNIPSLETDPSHSAKMEGTNNKVTPVLPPHNDLHNCVNNGVNCRNVNSSADIKGAKSDVLFPHNATFLIDHVIYLPVHKQVPFWYLDYICTAVEKVMQNRIGVKLKGNKGKVIIRSKL